MDGLAHCALCDFLYGTFVQPRLPPRPSSGMVAIAAFKFDFSRDLDKDGPSEEAVLVN